MAVFKSEPQSFLGIDLGVGSIKVVELKNENKRARLATYAFTEQVFDITKGDMAENKQELADLLKRICEKAKTKSTIAITAIPLSEVFSAIISLSDVTKKDLASPKTLVPQIEREAAKILPVPLADLVIDWKIVDAKEKIKTEEAGEDEGKQNVRILVTAAPKVLIKKYMEIFRLANLNLMSLETESFALIRSLVGNDQSTIAIIDIGATKTNITIVDKGVPFITRSINVGGKIISEALSKNLGITEEQAEQLKADIGLPAEGGNGNAARIIESLLAPIISEVKYCFGLFFADNNTGKKDIDKIILCGGSASMPNLAENISKILNLRVYVGDPWARVLFPEELKPVLDEIGPRFAVAVGLAMREIE